MITRQDVLTVLNEPTIKQRADRIMELIGGSEWISVDDRLPEVERGKVVRVITINKWGYQQISSFSGREDMFGSYEFYYQDKVTSRKTRTHENITHWMPLPEPPKETQTPANNE